MKGKTGNLIMNLREGDLIQVDGPALFIVKQLKKNKVVVLVNGDDETDIRKVKHEETQETTVEDGRNGIQERSERN